MALAGIIGAPLVWLAAEQAGYTLAYQACDARSRAWVTIPSVALAVALVAVLIVTSIAERRTRGMREPQPLLAWMSIGVTAMMVVVMAASLLGPLLLRPCD